MRRNLFRKHSTETISKTFSKIDMKQFTETVVYENVYKNSCIQNSLQKQSINKSINTYIILPSSKEG
jgi:hypothetical protein